MTIKQILLFKLHQSYQQQMITCLASENRTRDDRHTVIDLLLSDTFIVYHHEQNLLPNLFTNFTI